VLLWIVQVEMDRLLAGDRQFLDFGVFAGAKTQPHFAGHAIEFSHDLPARLAS
jgi:hypothetical protein